ncbi:MAG TPA: lipopolysaccharide heptosyltransferase II [Candidatus Acidoferrales bacterium]|nr:lipopolysaccharide heptosyltransferase II [Candidatus Acidoferrales bacterium]
MIFSRSPARITAGGRGEKILIVQTSFLGDLVLSAPLIAEVKRRFPHGHLAVLCRAGLEGLLEGNLEVDEVLGYDKRGGLGGLWRKAQELRRRGFTVAISPHKSLRTALLLFLAGIPCRVGFRQSAGWFLYHYRADRLRSLHDVERNLSILSAFGIRTSQCQRELRFTIDPVLARSVAARLESMGLSRGRERLRFGVSPGSVWPTKRWSVEGYAEVIRRLKEDYACEVLLFGGREDRPLAARLEELTNHAAVDLSGCFSLRELPAAIASCDLFICNDTGPMHIAVACGVPVVAIFCATTPSLGFYPYSYKALVVEKALHCRPCSPHGGLRCPLGTEDCIRLIGPEDVIRAVRQALEVRGRGCHSGDDLYRPQFLTL